MEDCFFCGTELYEEDIETTADGHPVCNECVDSMSDDEREAILGEV